MSPQSAYVHVPFCRHRCGYCNFTVVAGRDDLIQDYLQAIEIELSWLGDPYPVSTLFLGGGTPTHLRPSQLRQLLAVVRRWFPLLPGAEFSVEANPEDIRPDLVDVLANGGVNRISLGAQSFRLEKLNVLERAHRPDDMARCLQLVRPGIPSVSLDLIFAAPGETREQWMDDLQAALALAPDHLSTYGLTYELGTQFHSRKRKNELQPLPETVEGRMYEMAIDTLAGHGLEHYEVSNFAQPGHRCRHNENYWKCGEYFGVGPGASRYVNGVRQTNHRSTSQYLKRVLAGKSPVVENERLTARDQAHESLVFGLRRLEGVTFAGFRQATGFELRGLVGTELNWLEQEGLLHVDAQHVRLTRKGLLVSDAIWPHLL